jgi:transcriptional regulator NrdR family protein
MQPDNGLHQQIAITRNQNTIIKAQIQQAEFNRGDLYRTLKLLQSKREHSLDDVEDRKKDVHHKLAVIKELEAKRAFAADQLDHVELQVEQY